MPTSVGVGATRETLFVRPDLPKGGKVRLIAKDLRPRNFGSDASNYISGSRWRKRLPSGTPVLIGPFSNKENVLTTYANGWDTPQFHTRTKQGELIPMTPWKSFTVTGKTKGGGYADTYSSGNTDRWYRDPDFWAEISGWVIEEEEVQALAPTQYDMYVQDAAAKIYSSSYDALTALAELFETRRMFQECGKKFVTLLSEPRLRAALTKFRSMSKKRQAAYLIKDLLAGNWMELRYGWRTLLYDVEDINGRIETWNENRTRYSEKAGDTSVSTEYKDSVYTSVSYDLLVKKVIRTEVGIRGSVVADIEVPKLIINPVTTLWELTTLSFVVDWFLTVGKSLEAASFLATQTDYSAAAGYRVRVERTLSTELMKLKSTCVASTIWQESQCVASLVVRQPCAIPIIPHLALRLNSSKIIDLLAIIVQRVKGG
jgi:hypothetical protein